MSRSKKTSKKMEKIEPVECIFPELDNYDDEISHLYDSMKNGDRIVIKKDIDLAVIELCKFSIGFAGCMPYISLDIGIQYEFLDKKGAEKIGFYRYPLHIQQFEQIGIIKSAINSDFVRGVGVSIDKINKRARIFNNLLKEEKAAKNADKKRNTMEEGQEEMEIENEMEKEELLDADAQ